VSAERARRVAWLPLTVVALAVFLNGPSWASPYEISTLFTVCTLIALAQGWNLIGGFGGQFSLANHAFVGAGGYTTALVMLHTGLPVWVAIVAGGVLSALLAAAVSFPLFRLRGVYFSIGSLAVALAVQAWMVNWTWAGATRGLNIPTGSLPAPETLYRYAVVLAVASTLIVYAVSRTQFGLRLMAVRDHEDAAVGLGVRGYTVKATAFVASAFVTGLVGAVIALNQISIEPMSAFGLAFTINMIVMAIIGGIGTTAGPIVGVLVVYYAIEKQLESVANLSTILTGVLVILVIRFAPNGLWGVFKRGAVLALDKLRSRRRRGPADEVTARPPLPTPTSVTSPRRK
jgi:branched-chain amino acid transport system permease protein